MIPLHPLGCQRHSGSAAIPADSLLHRERILQPGVRKIVEDHLRHGLEQLELVALLLDPEHDHGLERRTAGSRPAAPPTETPAPAAPPSGRRKESRRRPPPPPA